MRVWRAPLAVPVAILLLCTCESFPTLPPLPPSADSIAPTALPQSPTVGAVLTPTVTVTDARGAALPRFQVTFAVTSGGGSVSPATSLTDDSGKASTQWTVGAVAGPQQVVATAGSKTTQFAVSAMADVASQIAASAGASGQTAAPGAAVPIPPSVVVRDARGNAKAAVAVTFAVASGGGSVTGGATTTDANGVATVGSWTLGPIAQTNTLTATSTGLTGSPVTFTATAVAVAGTLTTNGGNNQSAMVNSSVAVAPSVVIRDANDNPVVGASVTFVVASGGGAAAGGSTQTNGSGVATVGSWTLGTIAGINTLTATSTFGSATFTATGIPATASALAINAGNSQTSTAGAQVAIPPSVIVRDQYGNPVGGVPVTFAVVSGGGSIAGGQATSDVAGTATVASWTLGPIAGANTLTASSGSLTPVTFSATGTAGVGSLTVNGGNNQTATVNTPVPVPPSVIVKDVNGNPIAGVSVTFAVASGGGSVTGATTATNGSGIATVAGWTLGATAGANTLSATSSAGNTTFTATGVAGAASQIAVSAGNNQTAQVATAVSVTPSVIVRDALGNPKASVTVTFAVASGGGSVTGGTATTGADGIAGIGGWTLGTTVGANTLTATSSGLTGSPVTFTATAVAGTGTMTLVAGNNQTATVNTAVAVTPSVAIKDANSNPLAGTTVAFAVASGGGSISGGSATTDANGVATVGRWTLGTVAGTNTLTASSPGIIGSPLTFTATGTAGAPTMSLNAGNGQTANAGTTVQTPPSVVLKDQFSNPVSGVAVTFAIASGAGSVTGASVTSNASGIATVGSWTLGNVPGANTLTATTAAVPNVTITFTATGNIGPPARISISQGSGQTALVGTSVTSPPSVIVTDLAGNAVSGVNVMFAVASGGGSVTGPSAVTDANGIATVGRWTLGSIAGVNTLIASTGTLAPVTFTATGVGGPPATMRVNDGDDQIAKPHTDVRIPPSVIVKDRNGNPMSGVPVTFAVTTGGGQATGTSAVTDANGIARVGRWTLGNKGLNTLSAACLSLPGIIVTFSATAK